MKTRERAKLIKATVRDCMAMHLKPVSFGMLDHRVCVHLQRLYGFSPSDRQVRYAIDVLAKENQVAKLLHERGWYRWYTYVYIGDVPF